jgi:hypothetical protein
VITVTWSLAFVHELAHASLHPPGSEGDGGSDDPQEERCAHEAARLVCVSYGVNDYIKMMASHGVIPEALLLADQPFVDLMVDRIGRLWRIRTTSQLGPLRVRASQAPPRQDPQLREHLNAARRGARGRGPTDRRFGARA